MKFAMAPDDLRTPLPILYSFRRCPYAMRARLALAVSGHTVEHREVLLREKPPELLAASPKGTVPVLVLPGGEVIDESLNIMLWALRRHDPQQWLAPCSGSLPEMLDLIAQCDGPFKQKLDDFKYPVRAQPKTGAQGEAGSLGLISMACAANAAFAAGALASALPNRDASAKPQAQARQQASGFIAVLNQRLSHNACLFGPQLSLADAATLPFVRQFAGVQPAWFAQMPWQPLRDWLERFTKSTLFACVMQKQAPWQA